MRQTADVENMMTAVERVITYTELPKEPTYDINNKPPPDWPQEGALRFEDLSLTYYEGGPQVLKKISININAREKVGVAGRTGAGKSSLVSALFRMPEPAGNIYIDDLALSSFNVQSTRPVISVITQNPTLFGSILPFLGRGGMERVRTSSNEIENHGASGRTLFRTLRVRKQFWCRGAPATLLGKIFVE